MFVKFVKFFKKHLFVLVLTLIVALVAFFNYESGTWLTGWDNLHPEFNFPLNIKRSIFAVWQEYQGLGLLGGMGHASDLPRQIFLWFCSLFLPLSSLRYFYTFLMLLIGPLGVYYLIRSTSEESWPRKLGLPPFEVISLVSFLGALFYLLNLGTMQTFYVPFSAFTTHYGFLPWLIYVLVRYLKKPIRKNLFWLFLVNILAIPQAYVPTVFLVYLMAIAPFIAYKRKVKPLLIIFCVNAFWLLPFLYFILTNVGVVAEAKINQMVSEEIFLRNKMFGNLTDVMSLKGFWFGTKDLDEAGNSFLMLEPWIKHLENPFIPAIGYLFFAVILLGAIYSLKEKGGWIYRSLLFLLVFSFSMLAIAAPPFSWINLILRRLIPFFAQVFRFSFTKFSILALFSYSIFFALGVEFILLASSRLGRKVPLLLAVIFLILFVIFNLPSFQGNFIYKQARLKIPQEYFELFEFFTKQASKTRIANFPQAWYWGWSYYKWGYTGSGFLWYGIEQPILDRAFDSWSDKNEGYYWELSHAVYSHNLPLLEKVLEKYQINWILLDENVFATGSPRALQIEETKEMLVKSKIISPATSFGKLTVYQVKLPFEEKDFVFLVENPLRIEPTYKWAHEDRAFTDHGAYYSQPPASSLQLPASYIFFPFRELFTHNYVKDKNWQVEVKNEFVSFKTKLPVEGELIKGDKEEVLLYRDGLERYELRPNVEIKDNELEVLVPKYNLVKAEGLDHDYAYLLEIESRHISGKECFFYVLNETTKKGELEILLPKSKNWVKSYFILPPKDPYGRGYSFHFDNVSIGKEESVNEINDIKIFPIPYEFLKNLQIQSTPSEVEEKTLLVYSQSFDPDWRLLGTKNAEHVLVNNWANGWLIESSSFKLQASSFKIIYLPQFLEYFGFLLLLIFPLKLLFLKVKDVFVSKPVGKADVLARELDRRTPDSG